MNINTWVLERLNVRENVCENLCECVIEIDCVCGVCVLGVFVWRQMGQENNAGIL